MQTMEAIDRQHIWHPYTSMPQALPNQLVTHAQGVHLTLADGRTLIDAMSSWWSTIHGYNHPLLNAAAKCQLDSMAHVMFGGITHPPAIALTQRLLAITPPTLQHIFFCDSGSVAVEVAIKMALQYWSAVQRSEKNKLLTVRGGYHGDTFGTMAVCDPVTGMHHHFQSHLTQHFFADRPSCGFHEDFNESAIASFQQLISEHHASLAAVILEPIVQGAGGMNFYSPQYLKRVRELCDSFDVLLIADEIATGFGRTGRLFACEHAAIEPDILCLGKALTGGYLSLAATLCTTKISDGIGAQPLMHGPTFMANPLACAIALASIDLLLSQPWQQRIAHIEQQLNEGLQAAKTLDKVADVRVLGGIGVIEMQQPVDVAAVQQLAIAQGVWIRPFAKLIYTIPPYTIDDATLATITRVMVSTAAAC